MKALRIILSQHKACYKKEEADHNKMTYPLPPFSTVIGALHSACNFKEYHHMDISIQGTFSSMGKEVYRDHAFLNSLQNDRGILVKLANGQFLSSGFTKVASAQKSQGNDFEKEITIEVHDRICLTEYQEIKASKRKLDDYKKAELDHQIAILKDKIKALRTEQKNYEKGSDEFNKITKELTPLAAEEKELSANYKAQKKELDDAYAKFATLTTSIKYYEVLYGVNLILHVKSDENTLNEIENNIFNLRALGRSEDFVDVISCEMVELNEEIDDIKNHNSAYVKLENAREEKVFIRGKKSQGTKYYLNKNYEIKDDKRVFNKIPVLYISKFDVESDDGESSGIFIDNDGYIVNFI